MNDNYRTLRVDVDGHGVVTVAIDAPPIFAHGPQTRSELELGLGHRIAAVAGQANEPGLESRTAGVELS
jgi:hypothetical protein